MNVAHPDSRYRLLIDRLNSLSPKPRFIRFQKLQNHLDPQNRKCMPIVRKFRELRPVLFRGDQRLCTGLRGGPDKVSTSANV